MPRLNRDEYFNRLHEHLGDDTSDEAISFLEDMTDTYNELENRANANNDGIDWKERYENLDETWKKRYRHRFYSGGLSNLPDDDENLGSEDKQSSIIIDDLFK